MKEKNYQKTIYACFVGYVVQAIINNFVPLLFLTFASSYQISLSKITFLVTFNFGIQLCVDFHTVFYSFWIGKLENPGNHLGGNSYRQRNRFLPGADCFLIGR